MSTAYFLPLTLALTAYTAYYWTAVTTRLIAEARHARMKRHLDWTALPRRRLSKSGGWKLW